MDSVIMAHETVWKQGFTWVNFLLTVFYSTFNSAALHLRQGQQRGVFAFILEEVKHACQSAVYTYKVVRFFIKDYTNKDALRAVSKDGAESYTSLTRHKTRQGWCHYLGSLEVLSEGW